MTSRFSALFLLMATVALAGCDTSFDAFEEGAGTYSIFGTIDGNANEQYVRIEPLKDSVFAGTEGTLDARVTSENVETGEVTSWEIGAFRLDSISVRNAYTDADFQPGETYRFTVEPTGGNPDQMPATAEVTLPEPFPQPEVRGLPNLSGTGEKNTQTTLLMEGIDELAAVRIEYDACVSIPQPFGPPQIPREQFFAYPLADTTRMSDGTLRIDIFWEEDIVDGRVTDFGPVTVIDLFSFEIFVAVASEEWPEFADTNPPGNGPEGEPLPPPGANTNIEGGTGFLGGIFVRKVDVPVTRRSTDDMCPL